jgi:AraC family transcriptional regulator of adaptative response/methylated-DNA-[protein]-cysteine methyltransferase
MDMKSARLSNSTSPVSYSSNESKWLQLKQRNAKADGHFVYGVSSTKIYCRPSCPSKLALRKNISFFKTNQIAEDKGFRPCKRCKPDQVPQNEREKNLVMQACEWIENQPELSVRQLATKTGLSVFHFQRLFKKHIGLTPKQLMLAKRDQKTKASLKKETSITASFYAAGFNSSGRFYEHSKTHLGMTPSQYRSGGKAMTLRYAVAPCPLGLVLVAGSSRGLCSVKLGQRRKDLEEELIKEFPKALIEKPDGEFRKWVRAVVRLISYPKHKVDLPLDMRGTIFQQKVWLALRKIPSGKTATYQDIAIQMGRPTASRAVAKACATNPVAVIVPCHRVVRKDGGISGYRWGVETKRQLLNGEGVEI